MNTLRSSGVALLLSLLVPNPVAMASEGTLAIRGDYPVEQVASGVYVIWGPIALPNEANQGFRSNPAFVLTSRGVVIVDPGISVDVGRMVLSKIRSLTDGVETALNSRVTLRQSQESLTTGNMGTKQASIRPETRAFVGHGALAPLPNLR